MQERGGSGLVVRAAVAGLVAVVAAGAGAASAAAQAVIVGAGDPSAFTTAAPGADVELPLWLAIGGDAGVDVASVSAVLRWDPARLEYVETQPGAFGSLTVNEADAGTGLLRLAIFAPQGTTTSAGLATLRFRVLTQGSPGTRALPVHVEVTALGDEEGVSLAPMAAAGGCALCVADRMGDVNADGALDIIDAQQIARHVVELSVTDEFRFPDYADVNTDAAADIIDAQQIARCAVGLAVVGDWCTAGSCEDLFAADGIRLAPTGLSMEPGEIGALTARLRRDGGAVPWPAGAAPAWGLVNTNGAVAAIAFGDSVLDLDAIADGSARVTARFGTAFSAPATVQVGAAAASDFNIEIRTRGGVTMEQQAAIQAAADRWMPIIIGDVPDHPLDVSASQCHPAMNETVDDLIVFVELDEIDGVGGILGSAGPCYYRTATGLPITGLVRLDVDDVDAMIGDGSFHDVIVHEIGHVLGLGTLWELENHSLLAGAGGSDPYFTGSRAIEAFLDVGGDSYEGSPVPVENTGGSGTRDGHWRESVFVNELMTGWINDGENPLSTVTIGSFEDMGYLVDYSAADPYAVAALALFGDTGSGRRLEERLLTRPTPVGPGGRPASPLQH